MKDALCSITGRPCRCQSGEGCVVYRGRSGLDADSDEAIRWARTAGLRLKDAADALALAESKLSSVRAPPGPEWRDKIRRIRVMIEELEEDL